MQALQLMPRNSCAPDAACCHLWPCRVAVRPALLIIWVSSAPEGIVSSPNLQKCQKKGKMYQNVLVPWDRRYRAHEPCRSRKAMCCMLTKPGPLLRPLLSPHGYDTQLRAMNALQPAIQTCHTACHINHTPCGQDQRSLVSTSCRRGS